MLTEYLTRDMDAHGYHSECYFLLSQTSDEGGGNGRGDFPHKGNHGYSAPTCVEVESLAPGTSPASTKVLLSLPPPRQNMKRYVP